MYTYGLYNLQELFLLGRVGISLISLPNVFFGFVVRGNQAQTLSQTMFPVA